MTTVLTLNWRYVESFELLTSKNLFDINFIRQFSKPGVYLWVEQGADGSFSNYVGKTNECLVQRNLYHLARMLSLKYSLPRCYNKGLRYVYADPLKYPVEKGYEAVLSPEVLSAERYMAIASGMQKYLNNLTLYFAPIEDISCLVNLEKQLISELSPVENIRSTKSQYEYYNLRHQGDLSDMLVKQLSAAALAELQRDPTRPSKARSRSSLLYTMPRVAEYEAIQEKIELLEELRLAEGQFANGNGIPSNEARSQILSRISK